MNEPIRTLGDEFIEATYEHFNRSLDGVIIHLRDARNILASLTDDNDRALAKSVVLLASASIEANLASLSHLGVILGEKYKSLSPPQIDYLRGTEEFVNDQGNIQSRPLRQSLEERLRTVPSLLAGIFGVGFQYPDDTQGAEKLLRTIAYRDAIVHPRWQRYLYDLGLEEAALAVDAVEWYLETVSTYLAPYLGFYGALLYDMPNFDESLSRPVAGRVSKLKPLGELFKTMSAIGFVDVVTREWFDSLLMTEFALGSPCEGDSDGSMLTRAALEPIPIGPAANR